MRNWIWISPVYDHTEAYPTLFSSCYCGVMTFAMGVDSTGRMGCNELWATAGDAELGKKALVTPVVTYSGGGVCGGGQEIWCREHAQMGQRGLFAGWGLWFKTLPSMMVSQCNLTLTKIFVECHIKGMQKMRTVLALKYEVASSQITRLYCLTKSFKLVL